MRFARIIRRWDFNTNHRRFAYTFRKYMRDVKQIRNRHNYWVQASHRPLI